MQRDQPDRDLDVVSLQVDWLYFVAFFAVAIGLVLYTRGEDEGKESGLVVASNYLRLDTYRSKKSSTLGDTFREGVACDETVEHRPRNLREERESVEIERTGNSELE
jgi:hypothetical protein